jgi:hypothetical protein
MHLDLVLTPVTSVEVIFPPIITFTAVNNISSDEELHIECYTDGERSAKNISECPHQISILTDITKDLQS